MSTEFFNDQWRIPSNENQNKVSNYSMDFDGSVDFVQIGPYPKNVFLQPSEAELNANGYSVSAWIKIDSSFASTGGIFANDGIPQTGRAYGLEFYIIASRKPVIRKGDGTGRFSADVRAATSAETVPVDVWTHIAFVLPSATNTTWQIYINGVASTMSTTGSGGAVGYSAQYYGGIGRYRFDYFNGKIDQVSIFDYELSATEVSTLYGGGTAVTNPMSLSPKPIAYYQLGDQSVSTGPTSDYLVPNNSLSDYVFNFDGSDDYIDLGTSSILGNSSIITLSAWFNPSVVVNNYGPFLGIRETGNTFPYQLGVSDTTKVRFIISETVGTFKFILGNDVLAINNWYHAVAVANGTDLRLYINGVLQNDIKTYSGTLVTPTSNILIGRQTTISTAIFNGELSNISMWDTNLSSTQVTTLYNNGSPATDISSLSPVSWWKLNAADTFDGSNWTINDYGSGGNDGTSSGMDSSNLVVSDLQQTSGYSPYALDFDGVNDYLDANRTVASNLDFSVSAWIKPTSYATAILGTRGLATASTSNGFTMLISPSGNLRGRIFTETSNNFQVQTGSIIPLNNWSHVAMTYDSSSKTLKTYLNGTEAGSVVGVDPSVASANNFIIGRAAVGLTSYDYFGGKVSNVSIFAAKLSSTEIIEIYNSGVPSNLNNLSGTKPTSWWQLGSNSSFNTNWTCLDEIGTNNAVSVNMTNSDIVDGVGYSASGLGTSSIDIKGDAPYSTANGLSENMDVLDRTTDVPS